MASNAKRKTTMSKLNRENKLRERRLNKQARKDARKLAPAASLEDVAAGSVEEDPTLEDAATDGPAMEDAAIPALAGVLETPAA